MRTHQTVKPPAFYALLLSLALACAPYIRAQQSTTGTEPTPQNPQAQQEAPAPSEGAVATFIGYATNRSIFFPDIATSPGPLSTGKKFELFVNQSISPPYIIVSAVGAAYDQARNSPKEFGQGWNAYGSRFGASLARSASASFFGSFVLASALHQDPRFFPESKPAFWRSLKYSAVRVVVTRNDAGKDVFNSSALLGTLGAEGLANVYLPPSQQTAGETFSRFGIDLAWRVAGNMFKDYWPTFFRNMGLNRLKVIPDPNQPPRR